MIWQCGCGSTDVVVSEHVDLFKLREWARCQDCGTTGLVTLDFVEGGDNKGAVMSNYGLELLTVGYLAGAPHVDTEALDATIVALMRCPKCRGKMHYEGYHNDGSYIALAVCNQCGYEKEF